MANVHDRFQVVAIFSNGSMDSLVDYYAGSGDEARGRATNLSRVTEQFAAIEVFDVMAHPGSVQLWRYEKGSLVKTEIRDVR